MSRDLPVLDRRQRFLGKTCLVTGGSRGLGLAAAQAFAREGARVVVIARDPDQLKIASGLVDQVDAAYINAGYAGMRRLDDMDEATWDRVFDTNVKGSFFLMQGLRPLEVERREAKGAVVRFHDVAPGGEVFFLDGGADAPWMIELVQDNEFTRQMFTSVWRASDGWEGTRPVRDFTELLPD